MQIIKILVRILRGACRRISRPINVFFIGLFQKSKINRSLIVFESEGDLSDNSFALFDYLLNNRYLESYSVVWMVDDIIKVRRRKYPNTVYKRKNPIFVDIKRSFYLATCAFYIYDHCNLLKDCKKREGQKIIYLSHGGILKKAKGTSNDYYNNDENYITGKLFIPGMKSWTQASDNKIIDIGFPRLDYFFKTPSNNTNKLKKLLNIDPYNKMFVWMPTYRKSWNAAFSEEYSYSSTGIPILHSIDDFIKLNDFLKSKNTVCVFKPHHLQFHLDIFDKCYSNICFLTDDLLFENDVQLYEFINISDALITDYSSVGYDYAITNKPIIYTIDDEGQYFKSRGFVIDPRPYSIGYKCKEIHDIYNAIEDICNGFDEYKQKRVEILPMLHSHIDGYASKRIVEHLRI